MVSLFETLPLFLPHPEECASPRITSPPSHLKVTKSRRLWGAGHFLKAAFLPFPLPIPYLCGRCKAIWDFLEMLALESRATPLHCSSKL